MRFQFTLNMPSRSGNAVHQIVGEHRSNSLEELVGILKQTDFIILEEQYATADKLLEPAGKICISTAIIGKVKEYTSNRGFAKQ